MEIKACLFDLDGVIVDTAKYHFIAWREIADELGFEFTEQNNERLKGVSRIRSLEILLEVGSIALDKEAKELLAAKKNNNYLKYIYQMTPDELLPNAKNFLKECKDNKIKTAIGSASKNAMLILERLQIVDLFDCIIDGTKVNSAKPDPEVFLKGAKELKIDSSNCIVFEDAEAGIEAAINAKMKSIGIGKPEILYKADLVIPGFQNFTVNDMIAKFS